MPGSLDGKRTLFPFSLCPKPNENEYEKCKRREKARGNMRERWLDI